MKKKAIWLLLSFLMVLSLVLASCAPVAPEKEEVTPAPKEEATPAPKEVTPAPKEVTPVAEKPQYGGTLVVGKDSDVRGFDQAYLLTYWHISNHISYDELLTGDWTRGPAGTGETDWTLVSFAPEGFFRETGEVAESWTVPDNQTLTFKIRQGIYFHNKPPANGRELTPDDVVFSIKYVYLNPDNPNTYNVTSAPGGKRVTDVYIDPNDKQTVVVKVEDLAPNFFETIGDMMFMVPRESIEKYGSLKDWRNSLGTGPFILTDYVAGSSLTFVRNPNYWKHDPIGAGKGNQLPYIDGVKALIMPDKSTMYAAFRTGKIDQIQGLYAPAWEDIEVILKTNPETKYKEVVQAMWHIGARLTSDDPQAEPLKKKRVRQALAMAVDQKAIVRDLYQGKAPQRSLLSLPGSPYYSTDDEMAEILQRVFGFKPEEAIMVKKMWEYHPDEARKILAEEGYPNGFKTTVVLNAVDTDLASVVKEYWAKIGVDLTLDVRELGVHRSIIDGHKTQAMFISTDPTSTSVGSERWIHYGPASQTSNRWEIIDPVLDDYRERTNAVYGDFEKRSQILKEAEAYIMQLAVSTYIPAPYRYNVWQPWLKNYHGEAQISFKGEFEWTTFAWYDRELKKEMGY